MKDPVPAYLQKRAAHVSWPWIEGNLRAGALTQAVVIPVLAESANLFLTLSDLAANSRAMLENTVVLCVVNNRQPDIAGEADCADNQRTLEALPVFAAEHPGLRLAWIDAASTDRALGPKEGVGLARKIGLDWALALLQESRADHGGALICLDADTRVEANYLATIHDFFQAERRWAAVVDYAHPVDGPDDDVRAILSYELFLRYQELAWRFAGSPYAYPAIGSTMLCTGEAYAASGGMNRRQAGEDFYFLQQLAKTGKVERVHGTTVIPSGRASHRVPFGTGRKVGQFKVDEEDAYLTYHADTWKVLRSWLTLVDRNLDATGAALMSSAEAVTPELSAWLAAQDFTTAWERIRRHCTDPAQRRSQFHGWFDAFRTLKLAHHLRDSGLPRQDLFESLAKVMAWLEIPTPMPITAALRHDVPAQRSLLQEMREKAEV
ncbi:MAG: hypothetical protein JNK74_05890 [Candidatus Hydrogenedentes bacterium]|nr:hypothetical protein [Candidatus Hydrogenedentota bacterium]